MFRNSSGQINLLGIVGIGITIVIASIGGYFAQTYRTDSKIEVVKTEISAFKVDTGKEISTLNAESAQYRKDIDGINKKLDEIIKILR